MKRLAMVVAVIALAACAGDEGMEDAAVDTVPAIAPAPAAVDTGMDTTATDTVRTP